MSRHKEKALEPQRSSKFDLHPVGQLYGWLVLIFFLLVQVLILLVLLIVFNAEMRHADNCHEGRILIVPAVVASLLATG